MEQSNYSYFHQVCNCSLIAGNRNCPIHNSSLNDCILTASNRNTHTIEDKPHTFDNAKYNNHHISCNLGNGYDQQMYDIYNIAPDGTVYLVPKPSIHSINIDIGIVNDNLIFEESFNEPKQYVFDKNMEPLKDFPLQMLKKLADESPNDMEFGKKIRALIDKSYNEHKDALR